MLKSSPTALVLVVTVCIIEAPARCARLGPSMGINHILHQQPTYIASAPFKTPTDFFANNYLQHANNITFMLQKYRAQINMRSASFEAPPFDSWITESGKRIGFLIEFQTKGREDFTITEKAPWFSLGLGYNICANVTCANMFRHLYV